MKELLEGSKAIAKAVAACRPAVVSAYPITPQTHIVENLAEMKANGEIDLEFIRAESEFAAASIVQGASLAGVRSYTASASQGLLLMTEVLFSIAGMRLPVVLTCANRAVSSPINIWNDQQDAMTIRDAGWVMFFAEDLQEAVDMHILAFYIAESLNLPVMVNMDGFYLTHAAEIVDLPEVERVNFFLPSFKPKEFLDPGNPRTFGFLSDPEIYEALRLDLHRAISGSLGKILDAINEFVRVFGRVPFGLIEKYKTEDAEILVIAMGSIVGTLKEAVDELRQRGVRAGVLKISSFRPFPEKEILDAILKTQSYTPDLAPKIIVLDRAISLGSEGILAAEIKNVLFNNKVNLGVKSEVVGLGGKDITVGELKEIIEEV